MYYGFYAQNTSEQVTSIEFLNSSINDIFGFDNLTVGSFQHINPNPNPQPAPTTPESSSILGLLTVGLLSLGSKLAKKN